MSNTVAGRIERGERGRVRNLLERAPGIAALALVAGGLIIAPGLVFGPAGGGEEASFVEPATVVPIAGTELSRVTLDADAAERVGIRTVAVRERTTGGASRKVVPYSALLYDANGKTWVYTSPKPLTFVRAPVEVVRIDGETAILARGPARGTAVASVGAAELYGTELGVDH